MEETFYYEKNNLVNICSGDCAAVYAPVMAAGWQEQYPWAKESVEYCLENNIISGDETGDLMLGGNLTREQMAKIFTDTFDLQSNSAVQFNDVEKNKWSYKYVQAFQDYMPKKARYLTAVNM